MEIGRFTASTNLTIHQVATIFRKKVFVCTVPQFVHANLWTERPRAITLGADKAYDAEDFVNELRSMKVTPHVAARGSFRVQDR